MEDILNETITRVSHNIATGQSVTDTVRVVDVERESLGAAAWGLTDDEIAQIIYGRRVADAARRDAEADRQALAEYCRETLAAYENDVIAGVIEGIHDEDVRGALAAMNGAISALIVLGGYRGDA